MVVIYTERGEKKMTDEDIDYSDIPKMTKEELLKFKTARLREKNNKNIAS